MSNQLFTITPLMLRIGVFVLLILLVVVVTSIRRRRAEGADIRFAKRRQTVGMAVCSSCRDGLDSQFG